MIGQNGEEIDVPAQFLQSSDREENEDIKGVVDVVAPVPFDLRRVEL